MTARPASAALAAALLAFAASACSVGGQNVAGSGRPASESRPVAPFDAISASLPGEIVLRQGPAAPVVVEADDNLLPLVETVVEGGTLRIRLRPEWRVTSRAPLRVVVTAPALRSVNLTGAVDVQADRLSVPELDVTVAGSGDVRIGQVETGTLRLTVAGSGDFRAAGRAGEFTARVAGSGDIDAEALETKRTNVAIAGSGDARVWATESLSARIAGSGDVSYRGNPAVTRSVAGSGSVRPAGSGP